VETESSFHENGCDVVVGYLESHGREETVAQAEGLEIVPRRSVVYLGTLLQEMDLPVVLACKPES
jgi:two-component system sensor histidine kinase KdpD